MYHGGMYVQSKKTTCCWFYGEVQLVEEGKGQGSKGLVWTGAHH